ncbi:MAG: hypothetical protein QOF78_1833, partial [Phycisphaerales bacterium]|nr:hypothetical protein [Phycisphaerales bacterium]
HKHPAIRDFWDRPSRPSPGTGLLTSRHFPDDFQGNFLNLNVIGFQGIYRVKVIEAGSGLRGEKQEDLVSSDDPNFRPTAVNVGPDGAIYFADWHNPIIGHMQHHIRDPNRDHAHGRVYRLTYEGRPLMKRAKIDGQPIAALLELLKEPENQTRELARIELGKHDSEQVISAAQKWATELDKSDPAYEHHMTEALWLHQWHDIVNPELLTRMLNSPEPRARAAATRVLCYWRDRVPDALALLAQRAADDDPRVQLQAVRAASFFPSAQAADVAVSVLKHPREHYIDYTLRETIRQLDPHWRQAYAAGKPVAAGNPRGFDYLMKSVSTADLMKFPHTVAVLRQLLGRPQLNDAERHKLLSELAEQTKVSTAAALLDTVDLADEPAARGYVIKLLPQMTPASLKPLRERISKMAEDVGIPSVRVTAWAGLATADESFEKVWSRAEKSETALADLLYAVPLVYDPSIRARAHDRVIALLSQPPATPPSPARHAAIGAAASINRGHAKTFAVLADLIERGEHLPTACAALRSLPRSAFDAQRCETIAAALVKWARAVPAEQRTSQDYLATVQSAESLVALLPPSRAAAVLDDLRELRVAAFIVGTVREQMRYDTPRLVVEAGKPFEITFENTDLMPHNLAIVKPGSRKRIGEAAMKMKPDQHDAAGRAYVPPSDDILAATKLLENGQRETLKLTAPEIEGDCEYVCTYPDHWPVMWGQLIVTKDIEAYLRANPEKATPATTATDKHVHK